MTKKRIWSFFLAVLMILSTASPALADLFAFVTVEEPEPEAPQYQAGTLEAGDGSFRVVVTYGAEAEIPEGAELVAYEVTDPSAYKAAIEKNIDEQETVSFARFFDIAIMYNGEKRQPKDAVNVSIECEEFASLKDDISLSVVHFPDVEEDKDVLLGAIEEAVEGLRSSLRGESVSLETVEKDAPVYDSELSMEMVNITTEYGQVSFDTDGFSVYGVFGTQRITVDYLTADGKSLTVSVDFDDDAQIPAGAKLEVKEITEEDENWFERSVRLAEVLSDNYGNVTINDIRHLSIRILVNGEEFEPKAPVQVTIKYNNPLVTKIEEDPIYDELIGEYIEPKERDSIFAAIHYVGQETELIEYKNTIEQESIVETICTVNGFSDYDFVSVTEYDASEISDDYKVTSENAVHTAEIIGQSVMKNSLAELNADNEGDTDADDGGPSRNAGDVPTHNKNLIDNGNGIYTISLDVTGDADTDSNTASNANVIIIYDVSTSMTYNYVPMATGGRGLDTSTATSYQDGDYFQLYQRTGNDNYTAITNDTYTGTVYRRTGGGGWWGGSQYTYTEYTGQRYSYSVYRADAGEKTVYDFAHALFGYQNPDDPNTPENESQNIQAAYITFADQVYTNTGWTSTESTITNYVYGSGTQHHNNAYHNYTNWQGALQAAQNLIDSDSTDDDPTYVIFITDGRPQTSGSQDAQTNYINTIDEAASIQNSCNETGGAMYGIYAYGKEQDWLASLMYAAYHNEQRPDSSIEGTTFETEGYYKATDSEALTNAINDIFQKIVQTLGVTNVAMSDGTTSNVQTSTGVAHLLDVDTDSFQYWLSIPVTAGTGGTYTFDMIDKVSGDLITYTVSPSESNVIISWNGGSETYPGSVNLNTLTIQWTGSTTFYDKAAPAATFTNGSVDWNLRPVGTLLDGVTYTVTFDCYPSQETLDLIADLKNGDIAYNTLDPAIKTYLTQDYQLKTNTAATLSYEDTRPGGTSGTVEFDNPEPQPVSATEQVIVSKTWNNTLDNRTGWVADLQLFVTRDGVEGHAVDLTSDNNWTNTAWISYGIITEDDTYGIRVRTTGHDYSFAEDVETGYYWVIKAPTVRPMMINGGPNPTLLKLIEEPNVPPTEIMGAPGANAKAVVGNDTYYKLTIGEEVKYYVVIDDINAALTAVNHRRSYLDVVKTITGSNVPEGDAFDFTMTVNNANVETANPEDPNSDAWIWFSIWDNAAGGLLIDPDVATASGLRWQLQNNSVVTEKPTSGFNGYFCVPSGSSITVYMQNGYSLRFLNLPDGSTYSISESSTMPADGYSFVSIEGTRSYDEDMEETTTDDWKTDPAGTVSGQSISGTIEYVESAYKVEVTNKWENIDIKLKKVDGNGTVLDGSTFTLTRSQTTIGDYSPDSTTEDGNPIDLGGLGIGIYKLEETVIPTNYEKTEDIYFEIYKDTDGSLKARLVDSNGTVLNDQSAITSVSGTDGLIYTITAANTLKTAKVIITKNVDGLEGDLNKVFTFTTTGVADTDQTAYLVGNSEAENHSVTYENVPYGSSVIVSETVDNFFTTTYKVNGSEATTGTSASFIVNDETVSNGIVEVEFTNTRSKQLIKVYKYETGNENKALEGAKFSIIENKEDGISYSGLTTNSNGYLEYNESIYIELPAGSYTLKETLAPNGYIIMSDEIDVTVDNDGVSINTISPGVACTSEDETINGTQYTVYQIKVQNSGGTELPNTGSAQTAAFIAAGVTCAVAAGIVLHKREKKDD